MKDSNKPSTEKDEPKRLRIVWRSDDAFQIAREYRAEKEDDEKDEADRAEDRGANPPANGSL